MAPNRQDLEARIETLERRQEDLLQIVAELQAIAPIDMDDTPMSITDAKTWKHPEMALHVYEGTEAAIEDDINNVVQKSKVREEVKESHDHTNAELKATITRLIDEGILSERNGRVKVHPDARDIDPERLFKSNLDHAAERREHAADKGKSVDNPDDKYMPR